MEHVLHRFLLDNKILEKQVNFIKPVVPGNAGYKISCNVHKYLRVMSLRAVATEIGVYKIKRGRNKRQLGSSMVMGS